MDESFLLERGRTDCAFVAGRRPTWVESQDQRGPLGGLGRYAVAVCGPVSKRIADIVRLPPISGKRRNAGLCISEWGRVSGVSDGFPLSRE
jgi:hypothetical protein